MQKLEIEQQQNLGVEYQQNPALEYQQNLALEYQPDTQLVLWNQPEDPTAIYDENWNVPQAMAVVWHVAEKENPMGLPTAQEVELVFHQADHAEPLTRQQIFNSFARQNEKTGHKSWEDGCGYPGVHQRTEKLPVLCSFQTQDP